MTAPLEVGRPSFSYIDPTGVEWPLSDIGPDRGFFTPREVSGWGARPFEYSLDPVPRGGDAVRYIRAQSARITWPLHIWGETHIEFAERYRTVRRAFLATVHMNAPGLLRVALPDGTAREIEVFYESGFEGQGGENWLFANPVLTLMCPDGYWRDTTPTTVTRTHTITAQSFLNPFLTVSSSQVLGATLVDNPGDVEAWPEWVITGPMTSLTATSNTLGQEFILTHSLATNADQIRVTTLRPTVRGPADENLVAALNWPDAYLWALAPGLNDVEFVVGGASTGTSVSLTFYPRYDGV